MDVDIEPGEQCTIKMDYDELEQLRYMVDKLVMSEHAAKLCCDAKDKNHMFAHAFFQMLKE